MLLVDTITINHFDMYVLTEDEQQVVNGGSTIAIASIVLAYVATVTGVCAFAYSVGKDVGKVERMREEACKREVDVITGCY